MTDIVSVHQLVSEAIILSDAPSEDETENTETESEA
jgi:hypothetical protein